MILAGAIDGVVMRSIGGVAFIARATGCGAALPTWNAGADGAATDDVENETVAASFSGPAAGGSGRSGRSGLLGPSPGSVDPIVVLSSSDVSGGSARPSSPRTSRV